MNYDTWKTTPPTEDPQCWECGDTGTWVEKDEDGMVHSGPCECQACPDCEGCGLNLEAPHKTCETCNV